MAALAGVGLPGRAATFDCDRATQPIERAICGDATLSAVHARVEELTRRLETAPWRQDTRDGHDAFDRARERQSRDPAALLRLYRDRLVVLERESLMAADPRFNDLPEDAAARDCLMLPIGVHADGPCSVVDSGVLGAVAGRAARFAVYDYEGWETRALLILGPGPAPGRLRVALVDTMPEGRCEAPRLLRSRGMQIVLWRCTVFGASTTLVDRVWRLDGDRWHLLAVDGWRAGLIERLGPDYRLRGSPVVDYEGMRAVAMLRHFGATASGQLVEARISLDWEGEALVLRSVHTLSEQ